jgi:hypothetical protein
MKRPSRRVLVSAWIGFSLAALFLYPLATGLNDDIYYLQWQRRDLLEAVVGWLLLWLLFGVALYHVWPRRTRAGSIALLVVAALPIASLAAGVLQQLPFDNALIAASENRTIRLLVSAVVVAVVVIPVAFWPRAVGKWLRLLLIGLSPVSLVVIEAFVTSSAHAAPPTSIERTPQETGGAGASCSPVLALLFDELSFAYLTDGNDVRRQFPSIRGFSERSTNYLAATAPGRDTLVSVPSYLAARHLNDIRIEGDRVLERDDEGGLTAFVAVKPDGLFATSRRLGFTNEMAGYYLAYCDLLGNLVDTCRSFSFYNTATVSAGFSPIHPILTTLILWPRQPPFGLLKNLPFARLQRALVEHALAFSLRPMNAARPIFRLVHFSIPHLPFAFDGEGYDPPFDPLRTSPDDAYVRQIGYVDRVVSQILARLRGQGSLEQITVVLFSDHGFRFGGRDTMPLHIPFIVKRRGQTSRIDITQAVSGERLLKEIVEDACR